MSTHRVGAAGVAAAIGLGAFLRIWALTRDGGARTSAMVYDDGVYVAAGRLLRDGHVPFRDFVFVQPPGLSYVVALVSLLWSDPEQLLITMRWVAVGVGVANVVLVAVIVWRHVGVVESAAAALVYAVLPEAVYAEHTVIIEPWLNFACLSAVLLWLSVDEAARGDGGGRFGPSARARTAGALLAFALTCKLWAAFCVVACVVAAPRVARRRRLTDLGTGAAIALALLWLPLFVLAPREMFDQVIGFQVDRPADGVEGWFSRLRRMAMPSEITDAGWWRVVFVVAVLIVGAYVAWRVRTRVARLTLTWFAVTIAAFLVASTWWEQYSAHLAAPFALLAGVAAHGIATSWRTAATRPRSPWRPGTPVVATALAVVLVVGFVVDSLHYSAEHTTVIVDAARDIERFVPDDACVIALEPGWLVMAGRVPTVDDGHRFAVDPYASLILGHDLTAAIDSCRFLVVSDFRLSMLSPELQRSIETQFVSRSDPSAGVRVLERA